MSRLGAVWLELSLLAFFLLCWILFFGLALFGYPLAGRLSVSLYELYGLAALVGWLLGNVFVQRSRNWERTARRRLLAVFVLCPAGLFYLVWSFQEGAMRLAAPFAPLYAYAVSVILFLVPVSFRSSFGSRAR